MARRRPPSALSVPNFRLYFIGQMLSTSGSWAHIVATSWLVLQLTGSGTALGLVNALQALPVLLFGPLGGAVADRFNKRTVLFWVESTSSAGALTMGLLVATDRIELWMVYALSWVMGCAQAVDIPTRQTFIVEMVEQEQFTNAVTLNSIVANISRLVGPAIAGITITTVGIAPSFFVNAASYLLFLGAVLLMDQRQLRPAPTGPRQPRQLREGFAYVRRTPILLVPLLMLAVIGTLAYEMPVVLPLIARFSLGGDAGTYSLMTMAMGIGAIVAGTVIARQGNRSPRALGRAAIAYGALVCVAAAAPNIVTMLVALVFVGAASIVLISYGNATLQVASDPAMRGRVIALWTVAFVGSTPIGGPIVGWISDHGGPRWGLALGGVAAMAAGILAYGRLCAIEREHAADPAPDPALGAVVADSVAEGG